MYIYFRDALGTVRVEVDAEQSVLCISFINGYCYFSSDGKDYKVPVSEVIAIQNA